MEGVLVASGFLLMAAIVAIPATAGRAGVPLLAGAGVAALLSLLPSHGPDLSRRVAVGATKIVLYVAAWRLTDGVLAGVIVVAGLLDLLAGEDIRPQLLTCLAWIVGTFEIGVALIGYIDGYTRPGYAAVSDFTYAISMVRGVPAFFVALLSLQTGHAAHERELADLQSERRGLARRATRASVLGYCSFWWVFTAPMLLYGLGLGLRLMLSPRSQRKDRLWGLTAVVIATLGTILGAGVFDYAVLEGRYGSAYWDHLR